MKNIQKLEFYAGSKEELLPDFESEFLYIASNAELDQYADCSAPWHWHKEIELFYMESGTLEYYTPKKKLSFPSGFGGFINSNVLHMTKAVSQTEKTIQRLHIFDTALISGSYGSRIEKKYVMPITAEPQIEIYGFRPDNPVHADILNLIKEAFTLCEHDIGYEIKIREALSEIWLKLFGQMGRIPLQISDMPADWETAAISARSSENIKTVLQSNTEKNGRIVISYVRNKIAMRNILHYNDIQHGNN